MTDKQTFQLSDLLSAERAAELLEISKRQVRTLVLQDCPVCAGSGTLFPIASGLGSGTGIVSHLGREGDPPGVVVSEPITDEDLAAFECPRCFGTGRRLPAVKIGRDWAIPVQGLDHVRDLRPGRQPNYTNKE
jgi:hypothetical protein